MIPSAGAIRWGMRLARWLPAGVLHRVARLAGWIGWHASHSRREVISRNLHFLVGDPTRERRLGPRVLANMMEAAVDLWRLPFLDRAALDALVVASGLDHLDAAIAAGRGAILATAHLGPYELAGAWLAHRGYVVHAMVERMPAETSAALTAYRSSTGMQLLDRSSGPRAVLRVLKAGEVAALVCDRMVGSGAPGTVVPFGAGRREIPTGPASLAVATGARVVTGRIVRDRARGTGYHLTLDPPLDPTGQTTEALTARIGERLSAMTVAHPDEWYVLQPAWRDVG